MSKATRWLPTEAEIEILLIDTDTHRRELSLVLRNQKVAIKRRSQRAYSKYSHKIVTRIVHFFFFDPDTKKWTGQIHRDLKD